MQSKNQIIQKLTRNETYPHETNNEIKVIETNVSYVFLTGPYAYKLKKTIKFGKILDYSTLELRHEACIKELELNKRLCPEIYLEVVSIDENLNLYGEGDPIDYLVKMKELPQEDLLSNKLRQKSKIPEEIFVRIAKKIATFHKQNRIKPNFNVVENIRFKWQESFETTGTYKGFPIDNNFIRRVFAFIDKNQAYWQKREEKNEIVDGHGDLILNNIFLHNNRIYIFDCIEFSEYLRFQDPFEEVAFLTMDLEFNGYHEYAKTFLTTYLNQTEEPFEYNSPIIQFYKSYRAFVRAKVFYSQYLQSESNIQTQIIKKRALQYLELSRSYIF
ncbi:MAG: hypothetical protein ACTSYD_06250 [Candidatus Heimdallarchaeaceae archaeon]